jgi:hypothetical protein
MQRSTPILAATILTVAALTACSSSSSGTPTTASTTAGKSPTVSAFPKTTSAAPTPTQSGSETVTPAELKAALLSPSDIGLTGATSTVANPSDNALPCAIPGSASLNQQVPATLRSGVNITDDALQAALGEEIRLFADEATATAAVSVAKSGLTCTKGSLIADDGTSVPITIQAPVDISSALAADTKLQALTISTALVWQATATGEDLDLVVIQVARALILFTFQSASGADASKLPDAQTVVNTGLEKFAQAD